MKKTIKLFAVAVAIATFGLNLSMDSSGSFSLISKVSAAPPTETEPEAPGKWKSGEVGCYDKAGKLTSTAIYCFSGTDKKCTPDDPCPTWPPDTEPTN